MCSFKLFKLLRFLCHHCLPSITKLLCTPKIFDNKFQKFLGHHCLLSISKLLCTPSIFKSKFQIFFDHHCLLSFHENISCFIGCIFSFFLIFQKVCMGPSYSQHHDDGLWCHGDLDYSHCFVF
jgi:hypothetical protein